MKQREHGHRTKNVFVSEEEEASSSSGSEESESKERKERSKELSHDSMSISSGVSSKSSSSRGQSALSEDSFFVCDSEDEEESESGENLLLMERCTDESMQSFLRRTGARPFSNIENQADEKAREDRSENSSTTLEHDGVQDALSTTGMEIVPAGRCEVSGDPRTCFLCRFGDVKYDGVVSDKMQGLWDLFAENYFSMTDTEGLAAAMYAYYLEEIYEPAMVDGLRLPKWSAWGIYIHITEHMGEPRIFLGESIKELVRLRNALRPFAFAEVGTNEETGEKEYIPRVKISAEIRMLTKQIRELYNSEPQDMFGSCDAFKADPKTMNRFVHMSRVIVEDRTTIESGRGTFS